MSGHGNSLSAHFQVQDEFGNYELEEGDEDAAPVPRTAMIEHGCARCLQLPQPRRNLMAAPVSSSLRVV